MLNMVCIGGGTGLPVLLAGLRGFTDEKIKVTAIVTVADSGGSSGMLREMFRMPAVGDIRNCLVALASDESPIADLWQYRFSGGDGLKGHAVGNLLLTALYQRTGGLSRAVEQARQILQSRGFVVPVSDQEVHLCAEYEDGKVVQCQAGMKLAGRGVRRVWLDPPDITASPAALEAIGCADAVILSPGSLYSSVVAALLVPGVVQALNASRAVTAYVCNLMTQPGETDNYTAGDHLNALRRYLGPRPVDLVILNSQRIDNPVHPHYVTIGSQPVQMNEEEISRLGSIPISADILCRHSTAVRHDPAKLARILVNLTFGAMRVRDLFGGTGLVSGG
jgi:uncharacterized cofD-like protein